MRIPIAIGWLLLMSPLAQACDVCGIFLGVQPFERANSVSMLWRVRYLEGELLSPVAKSGSPKHGGHTVPGLELTGRDRYQELFQVLDLRADIWVAKRMAVLASLPLVNNYQAINGVIRTDIYGVGDPLLIARYQVVNTKCLTEEEPTVHRLLLGAGGKFPLGRTNLRFMEYPVATDMQPGTGSVDLLASAEYMVRRKRNGAVLNIIARHNGQAASGERLGHGLSTTAELFRRYELKNSFKWMPSLGVYHELSGRDAEDGTRVQGTGGSTLFTHVGSRLWWRNWMLMANFQYAAVRRIGELMVPNRMRFVTGITYNFNKN